MKLISHLTGAIGCLFIKCSGIGLLDDAATRRYKASLFVAIWLMAAFFSALNVFSFWIYDLRGVYEFLWPFTNYGLKIAGLGALIFLGAPALVIALKVGKRYAKYAKYRAKPVEVLILGAWYIAVIMSIPMNKTKIGCLCAFVIHTIFFIWLVRENKRLFAEA